MGTGILEVSLVEAEDLKEKDLSCWLSCFRPCFRARKPYVLIQYGSQKHMSCVAKEKGEKEIYKEKFKFNVKYEGENDIPTNTKLILHIMDKHRLSSDKLVGETTIYVKDIVLDGMDEGKIDIEPQKHRVVRVSDKSYSGEISVALTFTKLGFQAIDETKEVELKSTEVNEENIENQSHLSATAIELV